MEIIRELCKSILYDIYSIYFITFTILTMIVYVEVIRKSMIWVADAIFIFILKSSKSINHCYFTDL